jgi:hypothetical protein
MPSEAAGGAESWRVFKLSTTEAEKWTTEWESPE